MEKQNFFFKPKCQHFFNVPLRRKSALIKLWHTTDYKANERLRDRKQEKENCDLGINKIWSVQI